MRELKGDWKEIVPALEKALRTVKQHICPG